MTTDAIDHAPGEHHLVHRTGWLRAAVLGANDGIISVSSLIVGVAAAPGSTASTVLVAGVAALVGGALAMAAGEYVSVSSQADTENADLARESAELERSPVTETRELAAIYEGRGVEPSLAIQVAEQGAPQGLSYGQRQSEQMVNKSLSVAAKYIKFRGFVRLDELEVTGSPLVMFHPRSS